MRYQDSTCTKTNIATKPEFVRISATVILFYAFFLFLFLNRFLCCDHPLALSRRDDSNEWSQHRIQLRLTLCMLGHFFKYFLSKDAKNHCFLPNILLIHNLNVKQFGSQMKPHIFWVQIVCIGHQRSSKFTASGLRVKRNIRKGWWNALSCVAVEKRVSYFPSTSTPTDMAWRILRSRFLLKLLSRNGTKKKTWKICSSIIIKS